MTHAKKLICTMALVLSSVALSSQQDNNKHHIVSIARKIIHCVYSDDNHQQCHLAQLTDEKTRVDIQEMMDTNENFLLRKHYDLTMRDKQGESRIKALATTDKTSLWEVHTPFILTMVKGPVILERMMHNTQIIRQSNDEHPSYTIEKFSSHATGQDNIIDYKAKREKNCSSA